MKTTEQNNNYYPTLDENFEQACKLLDANLSQNEIIKMLKSGNIAQKQIAALKIEYLENKEQAKILLDNLTGIDGKIREAVSLKINEIILQYQDYFTDEHACKIFIDAIIDVNPNICRNIISAITKLKNNNAFCQIFIKKLISLTNSLISTVQKIDFQNGKYKINKEVFKLYWCLETIYEFAEQIDIQTLKDILHATKDINEYTIREKSAKILSKNFNDTELINIKNILKNDENYYVRRF